MLLLAGLVTDQVSSLWKSVAANPAPNPERPALGYLRNPKLDRERIDKEAIQVALKAAKGKLKVAANLLGITSTMLVTELRHHRIHVPLSAYTSKRLGEKRITAVREALLQGISISETRRLYDLTLFSVLLIELDRPELCDAQREANIARRREKHREALRSFLRERPGESRRAFFERHGGAYGWLRKYDRSWLNSHLPESRQGWRGRRKTRILKDWPSRDEAASNAVLQTARKEFAKPDQPKRLSLSRLLRCVGGSRALTCHQHHLPLAIAEAKRLSETKGQFRRRAIRWALQNLAEQNLTISLHRLSHLAGTSTEALKKHGPYIIEVAEELGANFHARTLALLSDHRDNRSTITAAKLGKI